MRYFLLAAGLWLAASAIALVAAFTTPAGAAALAFAGASTLAFGALIGIRFVRPLDKLARSIPNASRSRRASELASHIASEHRSAVEALAGSIAEGRRRQAALTYTSDAVLILDENGSVEYANPTARMFVQDRILEATNRLNQPELERLVRRAERTGQPVAEDVTLWVPGPRPARARAVPLPDQGCALLLSDLSESHRLDKVRRDLVANVSHELKTPVAAIHALAETAATAFAAQDLATAQHFVERLGTESNRLAGLVTDLLDLSRVEAGEDIHPAEIDLGVLLAEAADRARVVAEVKGIDLVVHPTTLQIDGDPSQLSMAVKNLVDNAVRYSEGGKVEISVDRRGDRVIVTVADEGIGIPVDEIPRIFERFYRVDKARSRATGGTGLGLAIVRHVVENHGGSVKVESELGAGTRFVLDLPANMPEPS